MIKIFVLLMMIAMQPKWSYDGHEMITRNSFWPHSDNTEEIKVRIRIQWVKHEDYKGNDDDYDDQGWIP